MAEKNSFVFYRSFYDAAKNLPDAERLSLYEAVISYALNQEQKQREPLVESFFCLIKPLLVANHKRFVNGSNGGRPKKNKNQNKTKIKPKDNLNETETKPYNTNTNINTNKNTTLDNLNISIFTEEELSQLCMKYPAVDFTELIENMKNWCLANGKKYKDYKAAIRNWAVKEQKNKNNQIRNNYANNTKPSITEVTNELIASIYRGEL